MILRFFVILVAVDFLQFSFAGRVILRCHFRNWIDPENKVYPIVPEVGCFLDDARPIFAQNDADNFTFTDIYGGKIDERIRVNTNALIFRTGVVSFVPKEAFLVFPKLHRIALTGTMIRKLDVAFMKNFLKHQHLHYPKTLDFTNNRIEMIEPEVFEVLQSNQTIDLRNNTCISLKINPVSDNSYKILRLFRCFFNYVTEGPGKSVPVQYKYINVTSSGQTIPGISVILGILCIWHYFL